MKRFLIIALAMNMAMGSTVLAAEPDWREVRFIWVKKEEPVPVEKERPDLSWEFLGEEFFAEDMDRP